MPTEDEALRPSMPAEPEAQLRWLIARQTEALLKLSTSTDHHTAAVNKLQHHLVGGPNLIERVAAGRMRNAIAALAIVVVLSSLTGFLAGTAAAFTWRESWAHYPLTLSASSK